MSKQKLDIMGEVLLITKLEEVSYIGFPRKIYITIFNINDPILKFL